MSRNRQEVVYICGPLRSDSAYERQRNTALARTAAIWAWNKGYAVICPHLNSGGIHMVREETLMVGSKELVARCDRIVLIPGWERSVGSKDELAVANSLLIPTMTLSMRQLE